MRSKSNMRRLLAPAVLALALAMIGTTPGLGASAGEERFTAQAANLSNVGRGGAVGRVDVTIKRFSTDEEREHLRTALVETGTEGLLKQLQKMPPVGYIRGNDSIGWDLRYAMERTTGSTRRIIFATDRPVSWLEARNQPRTIDYRFTIGELKMQGDKGEGTLAVAVKVNYDPDQNMIQLENYASEPLRLLQVRATK